MVHHLRILETKCFLCIIWIVLSGNAAYICPTVFHTPGKFINKRFDVHGQWIIEQDTLYFISLSLIINFVQSNIVIRITEHPTGEHCFLVRQHGHAEVRDIQKSTTEEYGTDTIVKVTCKVKGQCYVRVKSVSSFRRHGIYALICAGCVC